MMLFRNSAFYNYIYKLRVAKYAINSSHTVDTALKRRAYKLTLHSVRFRKIIILYEKKYMESND